MQQQPHGIQDFTFSVTLEISHISTKKRSEISSRARDPRKSVYLFTSTLVGAISYRFESRSVVRKLKSQSFKLCVMASIPPNALNCDNPIEMLFERRESRAEKLFFWAPPGFFSLLAPLDAVNASPNNCSSS